MHRLFSRMEFTRTGGAARSQQLDEAGLPDQGVELDLSFDVPTPALTKEEMGGWLESDDIEDFD